MMFGLTLTMFACSTTCVAIKLATSIKLFRQILIEQPRQPKRLSALQRALEIDQLIITLLTIVVVRNCPAELTS